MEKKDNRNWINNLKNEIDKSVLYDMSYGKDAKDFNLQRFYDSINELNEYKDFDTDKGWSKISSHINRSKYIWLKLAASIIVVFSFSLSFYLLSFSPKTYTSDNADKYIVLEDGSDIILKQGATLVISQDFNNKIRKVELSGDGYFNIVKNKEKPFVILTKKAKVEVLGTVFYIDQEQDLFQLELKSGKVRIDTKSKKEIVVTPGHKAVLKSDILLEKVSDESLLNNNLNDLFLDDITLDLAVQKINRIYNKEIIAPLDKNLGRQTIHMTIKESSVREFLNGLKLIFNIDIKYSKGQYFIKSLKK